ncbi:MAG: M4 family metallopeptidase [Bacteroidia bacterium]
MKKIIATLIIALFASTALLAQSAFEDRTLKSPTNNPRSFEAEIIDGRKVETQQQEPRSLNANVPEAQSIQYKLRYSPNQGLPIYLEISKEEETGGLGTSTFNENRSVSNVLNDLPGLFQWNRDASLQQEQIFTDDIGITHIRYQQYYKGVKVAGGEWMLHSQGDQVISGNGKIYPTYDCEEEAEITKDLAISKAQQVGREMHPGSGAIFENSYIHVESSADLVVDYSVTASLEPVLCYVVEIRPTFLHHYKVWVDAKSAEVLKVLDLLCTVDGSKSATGTDLNNQSRSFKTYQVGSTYYMIDASRTMYKSAQSTLPDDPVGAIWTIDAQNTAAESIVHVSSSNNTWSDKSAVSAHYNAGLAYDYFKNTHNRNSINGSGGTIISVVNVAKEGGGSLENAYWNGQAMFYGNGGTAFKPLAGALDVAGHELTHGVVSNSANLEYQDQSGAINESMADIFGAMIDRDDWKMGEDVVKTAVFPSGALRDLQNPHNGGSNLNHNGYQPEKMSEYYTGTQDNGGVHINSGIVNKAYYLIATDIGKVKAERIYYRALTVYLTSRSEFLDLRYAVEDAADDLYGTTEVNAVKDAFDAVEIYDPNAGSGNTGNGDKGDDLPANPGTEFIVSVDVNPLDANTFYRSSTVPDAWQDLSTTDPKRKCSITDDGANMYYISDADDGLYRIQLSSPFTESLISPDDWDNVAISKDGRLLAAITTEIDSSIFVYDFQQAEWRQFKLYNPTYSEGVNNGNVLYADAIEFDHTGQYILYDARNIIENTGGADIDYWDVGEIRVWDLATDDWGDGTVEKVFTSLDDGVSIGNATYAKNSPYIIAFDYIDANTNSYAVLATNTITNTTATIFSHSVLGFPNYSTDDETLIFDARNTGGDAVIAKIDMDTDKINPKSGSSASVFISDGKWGVWYANGSRSLLSDKKEMLSFGFPGLAGQPEGVISGNNINVTVMAGTNLSDMVPTFTHSSASIVSVSNQVQVSGVNGQDFSSNVTYKVTAQDGTSRNYTVKVTMQSASVEVLEQFIHLSPNPASKSLQINSDIPIHHLKLISMQGKVIWESSSDVSEIDISALPSGLYVVELQTDMGKLLKRIVKVDE